MNLGLQRHVFGLNVPTVLRETLLMVHLLAHDDDGAPSPVVDDEPEEEAVEVEVAVETTETVLSSGEEPEFQAFFGED